jgi:beta-lactamase class A
MTPASVLKVQIALAVESAIASGRIDGTAPRVLPRTARTPGPTGISLMRDDVTMSVRDLVAAMLTISDNVATDALIEALGLDEINRCTRSLGLETTWIAADLGATLDAIAADREGSQPTSSGGFATAEVPRGVRLCDGSERSPTRGTG